MDISKIKEHMEVVGSDGQHVGIIDSIEEENQIKLTRSDPAAGGVHHWISMSDVASVDDKVILSRPAAEVQLRNSGSEIY